LNSTKIVSGIKWASLQFVIETFFRFSIRLILIKFLQPSEFGLVGMATIFIAVAAAASELGMSAALIQKKSHEEVTLLYNTAFWSGIIWGILVFLFLSLLIAPIAASFYHEPILIKLIPVLSLGILIKPFTMIHAVILTRDLNFKKLAKIANGASLIAGIISLIFAYRGLGVWALALNNILAVALTIPLFILATKWKPTFEWNKEHFKDVFGFGAYSTATSIFSTLTYNIDNLMIGKLLGTSLLGNYTLSFSLTEQVRQVVSNVLNKVMYPVFGKLQDDKAKLRAYFLKIININAMVIYPLMTYLLLFAEDIILGFFGDKWSLAILPLRILSIAMMIHLLVNSFTSLLRGLGKPNLEMKIITGTTIIVLIPSLYFGVHFYGLIGASIAILINKISLVIIALVVLKKEINLSALIVFKTVKGSFISALVPSLIITILSYFLIGNNFLIFSSIYIIVYAVMIFFLEKKSILELIKHLK
jgi:O-antigen/teichoic acid export membrane protein